MATEMVARSYENYQYGPYQEPTEPTLSDAGKAFLSNLPYLNAGGSVNTWKNTVKQRLEAAKASGQLSDEDINIIANQLELNKQEPAKTEEPEVLNRTGNGWVAVGSGRMTWQELESGIDRGEIVEIYNEANNTIKFQNAPKKEEPKTLKNNLADDRISGTKNALK